jgi:hypothetical protein
VPINTGFHPWVSVGEERQPNNGIAE